MTSSFGEKTDDKQTAVGETQHCDDRSSYSSVIVFAYFLQTGDSYSLDEP